MATILLVEDDQLIAQCYRTWLTTAGYKVQQVPDVNTALDCLDGALPDVILLDMLLSGATGTQLLHVLQSHADLRQVPVIICSNAVSLPQSLQAYGVRALLSKPTLTKQQLIAAVQGVL